MIYEEETFAIRGAAFEVYKQMSNGFLEAVYQECMAHEMLARGIPFIAQPNLKLMYKDKMLEQSYKPDFVCFDKIIVELKAVRAVAEEHKSQVINYLRATGFKVGLVVNFGHYPKVQIERIVL